MHIHACVVKQILNRLTNCAGHSAPTNNVHLGGRAFDAKLDIQIVIYPIIVQVIFIIIHRDVVASSNYNNINNSAHTRYNRAQISAAANIDQNIGKR